MASCLPDIPLRLSPQSFWLPPAVPAFAGPIDLANLIRSLRRRLRELVRSADDETYFGPDIEDAGAVTDPALDDLLGVAYQASFLSEEGRPVRAQLYVPPARPNRLPFAFRFPETAPCTLPFDPHLLLKDKKLVARLSAALPGSESALLISESGGHLFFTGVCHLDHEDMNNRALGMPRLRNGALAQGGLHVSILAPGELRVRESGIELTLRGGDVAVYGPAGFAEPARRWLSEFSQTLIARAEEASRQAGAPLVIDRPPSDFGPAADVLVLWSAVLGEMVAARHGGVIAVLPDPQTAPFADGYTLRQLRLGEQLLTCWLALSRLQATVNGNVGDIDLAEAKHRAVHHLRLTAQAVGRLTATDGCVVCDRDLVVHGFGRIIQTSPTNDPSAVRTIRVVGLDEQPCTEAELLEPFGTRHKSAFNLCKAVEGALAFVVSQDGELRLFAREGDTVRLYDGLQP